MGDFFYHPHAPYTHNKGKYREHFIRNITANYIKEEKKVRLSETLEYLGGI